MSEQKPTTTGLARFNATIQSTKTQEYLANALGANAQTFTTSLISLVANSRLLQDCKPISVMYAAMKAAALNLPLDPNLGQAYVLPYNNSKERVVEAQLQIGYKGFIQLAIRSGQFQRINVTDVRQGEIKSRDLLTGDIVLQVAENRDALPVIGYCAYFRLTNGFEKSEYWSVAQLDEHGKKYSQTYKRGYGLWKDEFDAMSRKTAVKMLLSRYAPLSLDMRTAIASDQAVFREPDTPTYADNVTAKDNIAEIAAEAVVVDADTGEILAEEAEDKA